MSGEENFSYNLEFIITINLHLQLGWIIYSNGVDVISYAPQIRYHIFNESKFVFDNITHRPYPPFATFSYIIWGAFNFAILVTGLVLIACSILVILYKGERNKI